MEALAHRVARAAFLAAGLVIACGTTTPPPSAAPTASGVAAPASPVRPDCKPTLDDPDIRICATFSALTGSNVTSAPFHADYNVYGEWGNSRRVSAIVSGTQGDPGASKAGGPYQSVSISFVTNASPPKVGQTYQLLTGGVAEGVYVGTTLTHPKQWSTVKGTVTILAVDRAKVTFQATADQLEPVPPGQGSEATGSFSVRVVATVVMNNFPSQ